MPNPPSGVKLTMQAACVMFEVKPIVKDDPSYAGRKIKDWWATAQRYLLVDTAKFLNDLKTFDRNNINERVILDIEPFMSMPEFQPEVIDRASKACSGICMWVRAMHKYYYVAKMVRNYDRDGAVCCECCEAIVVFWRVGYHVRYLRCALVVRRLSRRRRSSWRRRSVSTRR